MRSSIKVLSSASIAVLALAAMATAQNVSISGEEIRIFSVLGDQIVVVGKGADYRAGGNGHDADMILLNSSGHALFNFQGITADLTLGGGDQDGDIRLRDSDGTTTTIDLDGNFAQIVLGSPDEDGDLRLWDHDPDNAESIKLDGNTGNVTNQLGGNGLVKAWARINFDGKIASCYNCNTSTAQTRKIGSGQYEVDFTPLSTNISSRPVLCSNGNTAVLSDAFGGSSGFAVLCVARFNDASSVFVKINNTDGNDRNSPFTVVVF